MAPLLSPPPLTRTSVSSVAVEDAGVRQVDRRLERRHFLARSSSMALSVAFTLALANVEQGGAAGVAVLHDLLTGEPEIQVVMRQEHGREPREVLRLVLLQPKNLRGGETWEHRDALLANGRLRPAELLHDLIALSGSRRIAPQLGRTDDFSVFVERHEPVLLAADADGLHLTRAGLRRFQRGSDRLAGRVAPRVRVLFLRARWEVGDQAKRRSRATMPWRASTTTVDCVPLSMPSNSVLITVAVFGKPRRAWPVAAKMSMLSCPLEVGRNTAQSGRWQRLEGARHQQNWTTLGRRFRWRTIRRRRQPGKSPHPQRWGNLVPRRGRRPWGFFRQAFNSS